MANKIIFDGTIEIAFDGSKIYKNREGQLHCEFGPAVHHADDDGSAGFSGGRRYYLDGKPYSESEFSKEIARRNKKAESPCNGKTVQIDGKTYKLTLVD